VTAVAIVIPTLNRAALLRGAIASALRCEPVPDELVVVDCGSSDETRAVVRSFGNDVELIERRLPNAATARNVGLSATRSPYVGFLDSDDEALPAKTGGLAEALDASPGVALVHGRMTVVGEDGEELSDRTGVGEADREKAREIGTSYAGLAAFCAMYTSATLMRRESLELHGGYDPAFDTYEDWDLYMRLSLTNLLIYADLPAAKYRVWPGNVAWDRTARGVIEVARKHLASLDQVPLAERRRAQVGLLGRLAAAHHTLLERKEAFLAGAEAVRTDPLEALGSEDVRRALSRSVVPRRLLARRRPQRSG
jgi:glycosyltransferase involved in cell wall biosynthesis